MNHTTTYPLLTSRFDLGRYCRIDVKQAYRRKKGSYHCYSGERCCYVVESHHDTIQQFFVFPSELMSDWNRLLKHVESH